LETTTEDITHKMDVLDQKHKDEMDKKHKFWQRKYDKTLNE